MGWGRQDSNLRRLTPAGLQPAPFAARDTTPHLRTKPTMGFEPMTDRLQGGCSAGLSYVGAPPQQQRRTSA